MFRFLRSISSSLIRLLIRSLNIYATLLFIICFLSWTTLFDGENQLIAWLHHFYLILFEPLLSVTRPYLLNRGWLAVSIDDWRFIRIDFAPVPLGVAIRMVTNLLSRCE